MFRSEHPPKQATAYITSEPADYKIKGSEESQTLQLIEEIHTKPVTVKTTRAVARIGFILTKQNRH